MKALGYIRVSTADQGESRAGLEAGQATILDEIDRRLWELVDVHEEVVSTRNEQPELERAIQRIEAGEAKVLIAPRLDRLCRSSYEWGGLVNRALANDWQLLVCDMAFADMTTPAGRKWARDMASTAEYERDMISVRTKEALAALKARGVKLGAPIQVSDEVQAWVGHLRDIEELSYEQIARELDARGIRPPRAEQWSKRQVLNVYRRVEHMTADELLAS